MVRFALVRGPVVSGASPETCPNCGHPWFVHTEAEGCTVDSFTEGMCWCFWHKAQMPTTAIEREFTRPTEGDNEQ